MGEESANTEQGHAIPDPAGEKENQEEAPDSTKQVAGFASSGSTFTDGAGATKMLKASLATRGVEAGGAAVAVAVAEGVEHSEAVKIEAEHEKNPTSAPSREDGTASSEIARSRAGGAAIAALGIYNGTKEFAEARKKGDVAGQVVSGADLTVAVTNLGINVAGFSGRAVPEMLESGARIGGAAVLVAGSTIKVLNAKPEDRAAVATGEVVKDAVGLGAAVAGQSVAAGLGLTGASAAVAPVVLAAGAVYVADKGVQKVMDDRKSYQSWEKGVEAEKKPLRDTPAVAGRAPEPADYRHLMGAMRESSDNIRYEKIENTPVKRGPITIHLDADGRPGLSQQQIDGVNSLNRGAEKSRIGGGEFQHKSSHDAGFLLKVDLTKPQNLKEMGNAIDVEISRQKQIMGDNESSVPAYLRTSAGVLKDLTASGGRSAQEYMEAKEKVAWLQSGRAELTQYQNDLKTYNDSKAAPAQAAQIASARDSFQKASASPALAIIGPQPAVQAPSLVAQTGKAAPAAATPGPALADEIREAPSPSTQAQQNSDTPQQKKDDDIVTAGGIKADGVDCQGDFEVAANGQTRAPAPAPAAVLTANNARPTQQNNSPSV